MRNSKIVGLTHNPEEYLGVMKHIEEYGYNHWSEITLNVGDYANYISGKKEKIDRIYYKGQGGGKTLLGKAKAKLIRKIPADRRQAFHMEKRGVKGGNPRDRGNI